ncbi:MAG: hypothetical protein IKC17_03755 [Bacteroidales bacterium]|nr:hypothetical protein [Bacteroidales bacterium]
MKKTIYLMIFAVALLFASCEKYDHGIADVQDRLEHLTGVKLPYIDQQIDSIMASLDNLKDVDRELDEYIREVEDYYSELDGRLQQIRIQIVETESEIKGKLSDFQYNMLLELRNLERDILSQIKALDVIVADLQSADSELEDNIRELEFDFVQQVASEEQVFLATYMTLEQYLYIQTELSTLSLLLEVVAEQAIPYFQNDLEVAISSAEESMMNWVNEYLQQNYYDIAEVDAILESLYSSQTTSDEQLSLQLDLLEEQLENLIIDVKNQYMSAIEEAFVENEAVIDDKIANMLEKFNEEANERIDKINGEIVLLSERLNDLEEKFVSRIQSVVYIPEYDDNAAALRTDVDGNYISLDFFVTPKEVVVALADKWVDVVTLQAHSIDEVSVNFPTAYDLDILSFAADSTQGHISLEINASNLPDEFFDSILSFYLTMNINDGNSDFTTNPIQLVQSGMRSVDLGLPSGLLWASCNLGANSPREYGDYYAWGEIVTKEIFTNLNYSWAGMELQDFSGDPTYDAATAILGGGWRMPTGAEFSELLEHTNITMLVVNGQKFLKATSKTNQEAIYFSLGGYRGVDVQYLEETGYYWSSSPSVAITPGALFLYANETVGAEMTETTISDAGMLIRPVCSK